MTSRELDVALRKRIKACLLRHLQAFRVVAS
jgi:hypothetical protein